MPDLMFFMLLTLGAQVMCMPGTGRVVMYMVTQRYKYRVPMRKKNRLHAIDLYRQTMSVDILCYFVADIYLKLLHSGDLAQSEDE